MVCYDVYNLEMWTNQDPTTRLTLTSTCNNDCDWLTSIQCHVIADHYQVLWSWTMSAIGSFGFSDMGSAGLYWQRGSDGLLAGLHRRWKRCWGGKRSKLVDCFNSEQDFYSVFWFFNISLVNNILWAAHGTKWIKESADVTCGRVPGVVARA